MAEEICLKWSNHRSIMTEFISFMSTESLVDVTLACDGKSLKAHKLVLSACSPYLKTLFHENPCNHPIVILKDVKFEELKAIIDFMYHGEVNVTQDQLPGVIATAESLKVNVLGAGVDHLDEQSGDDSEIEEPLHRPVSKAATPTPKRRKGKIRKQTLDYQSDEGISEPESEHADLTEMIFVDTELPAPNSATPPLKFQSNNHLQNLQDILTDEENVDKGVVPEDVYDIEQDTSLTIKSSLQSFSQTGKKRQSRLSKSMIVPVSPSIVLTDILLTSDHPPFETLSASPVKNMNKTKKLKKYQKKSVHQKHNLKKEEEVDDSDGSPSRKVLDKIENTGSTSRIMRIYKCEEKDCTFKTLYSESLKRHKLLKHEKAKIFKCIDCPYNTSLRQSMLRHTLEVHQNVKPFQCSLCPYKCGQNSNLKRHMEYIHWGKKPYACGKCKYRSANKSYLKRHVIIVHEKRKDHACIYCKYKCAQKANLKRHIKLVHNLDD